jgi:hypothetical protein
MENRIFDLNGVLRRPLDGGNEDAGKIAALVISRAPTMMKMRFVTKAIW